MEEYREQARLRYNKIKDETTIYEELKKWDEIVDTLLQNKDDITTSLALLLSILSQEFIDKLEKYDRLGELQKRVSILVEKINEGDKQSYEIIKNIISLTKMKIPINIITDEEMAKRLDKELNGEN